MEKNNTLMKRVKKKKFRLPRKKRQNQLSYFKFPQDMNPLNMETGCVEFPSMEGAGLELKASGTYWHRG